MRTHVTHILGKLHLINCTQAALFALREGLADLDRYQTTSFVSVVLHCLTYDKAALRIVAIIGFLLYYFRNDSTGLGLPPDLKTTRERKMHPYTIVVIVVDILRDRQNPGFKREAEAPVRVQNGKLVIKQLYPCTCSRNSVTNRVC